MMKLIFLSVLCIILYWPLKIKSANILGISTTASRSHLIVHDVLFKGLAERGHNVTVVATLPPLGEDTSNYKYIYVKLENDYIFNKFMSEMMNSGGKGQSSFSQIPQALAQVTGRGNRTLNHPVIKRIMKEEQYDLVIVGWFVNDYEFGLASHFNCPLVIVSAAPIIKLFEDYVGGPYSISSIPSPFIAIEKRSMNFFDRLKNLIWGIMEIILLKVVDKLYWEPNYEYNFPPDKYPSLAEIRKNISLVIVNEHFSQDIPRANVPALIEAGGIQIKMKPDPLPNDIKEWLDSANDGAILFSMGSNLKSSDIPLEKRNEIFKAFSKLKQKIIWKFEDDTIPNKPENVMIKKWLPQDDILAHPNVVLFISHCGRGGLTESLYHGVPILGIPIFGDQTGNLELIVEDGWAVSLPYDNLSEESLYKGVKEVLDNPKYRNTVKALSQLTRDRPQPPLESALFWTEYVIRHKGVKHMQSHAVHLNLLQIYSLDVITFIGFTIFVLFKILKIVLKWLYNVCIVRKIKQKHE